MKSTWQHVAAELDKAAAGADPADVSIENKNTRRTRGSAG
jgi:hypothetical protein